MRIYELAEELEMDSQELIELLAEEFDVEASNHMSGVDGEVADLVREYVVEDSTETVEEQQEEQTPEAAAETETVEKTDDVEPVASETKTETEDTEKPASDKEVIVVKGEITTEELAEKIGIPPNEAIKTLMELEVMATINQRLEPEAVELLAGEYDLEVEFEEGEEEELSFQEELGLAEDLPEEELEPRPPVITVMGHVDHGKTQLLDTIRETDVVSGESGGITQSIGASEVKTEDGEFVFVDTPGHEAFTTMRARGAQVTDLVILVVAGDDGVMPQTVESINHARSADVPIIVAINKMDLPEADADRVYQQLSEHDLIPEAWGGDTVCVELSALEGSGIEDLLEMIDLQAEIMELKASPEQPVKGTVIEAEKKKGMGTTATVIVQQGTLEKGDPYVAGATSGQVKAMINSYGDRVDRAKPGTPVEILGFDDLAAPGDFFEVVETKSEAREIAEKRQEELKEAQISDQSRVTLDQLQEFIEEGKIKNLNIVVKADTQGAVEVLRDSFENLEAREVEAQVVHGGVGGINESDVMLAEAAEGMIVGFGVRPGSRARKLAKEKGVEIKTYSVIYEAIEEIKAAMAGMLEPEIEEEIIGVAEVREVFTISGVGTIAGCYVREGKIERSAACRLVRDGAVVFDGPLSSLRRFKEDVSAVEEDYECGVGLENFNDIKEGDLLEVYQEHKVTPTV